MRWRRKKPKRRGYVRPSRAKPKVGWTLRQLAALTGISSRTARLYFERGLIPRPPFKGPATRYQRQQLLHLVAVLQLRASERLGLDPIRKRIRQLSRQDLEVYATRALPPGPLATALGVQPTPAGPKAGTHGAGNQDLPPIFARWARIELALGLELHVREDASSKVLELARRLRELSEGDGSARSSNSAARTE